MTNDRRRTTIERRGIGTCDIAMRVGMLVLLTSAAACDAQGQPPASQPAVTWPNSDQRLNFSMGISPPRLRYSSSRNDPVLFPSVIWCVQSAKKTDGAEGFRRALDTIRRKRPDARIGWTLSASHVVTKSDFDPAEYPPKERFADVLLPQHFPGNADRFVVDIRRPEARERLAKFFVATVPADRFFLALDNFLFEFGGNPEGTDHKDWSRANFALLEAIYSEARRVNLAVVINAATRPEETWERVARSCDGMLFEMPIHPNVRKEGRFLEAELLAYRKACDAGKLVGLIPYLDDKLPQAKQRDEVKLVAACIMLVREPGDAIFVEPREYAAEPQPWMEWPAQFGAARGKMTHEGTRFRRDFTNARLTVEAATGVVTVER